MAPERDEQDELVALGVVARPHGVRGELRVHLYNPESSLVYELEHASLRQDGVTRPVQIVQARPGGDVALVVLDGCGDRDAADALRGAEICVPRSALPPLDDDEMYQADVVGLTVATEDGAAIGTVRRILDYPSVQCLEIVAPDGAIREVPMLERYVVRIDHDGVVARHLDEIAVEPRRAQ